MCVHEPVEETGSILETEAKDPSTECDKEQEQDHDIDLCAEGLEKEPGFDLETEESDTSTEHTEELMEEIESDLETEANDPYTVYAKELPDDPRIDLEKRANEPSTRDRRRWAVDTAGDRSPWERGKIPEGTPSLHWTAVINCEQATLRPLLKFMFHRGHTQHLRVDSSCVEASALNAAIVRKTFL